MENENDQVGFVASTTQQDKTPPIIYANDVEISYSLSDVRLRFVILTDPQCDIHMSFTTAKTLAKNLSASIREFENKTKHEIMVMETIQREMSSVGADK